jgi:hypothetical protein
MKLNVGLALGEVKQALRRSIGLYLTVALAFNVVPSLLQSLAMPVPPTPGQSSALPFFLLTAVVLLMIVGWIAIQRLSLLGERVGDAVGRSPVPTARMFGLLLLLAIPAAFLISPFIGAYQSGTPELQGAASTAILLILIILLFPLVRLILTLPIIATEESGVLHAIKRSWRLTRGNTWKLYGLVLLALFLTGLVTVAAQRALGSVLLLLLGQPEPWSVSALLLSLSVQLAQLTVTLPLTILIARLYAQAVEGERVVGVPDAGGE